MTHSGWFAIAWLAIGIAWGYRAITRKEYPALILAAAFVLLGVFSYVKK
jgi:hypothetical protein